jgi:glycosyltransferase involved in cell wall biosynthesis
VRRRLLLVSYFFPPLAGGGVYRALALARHLPRHGWACTVLCAGEDDYWVRDESLLAQVPPETELIRVRGGSAASLGLKLLARGGGRRPSGASAGLRAAASWFQVPDAYAGWARRAARAARARAGRGDLGAVLSTSPPDSVHAVGRSAARAARVPWVADFRDPWVGLYFKRPPTAWHRARHAALERRVLEEADLVTVASRTHLGELGQASGARPRRAEHWPNGFEVEAEPDRAPTGTTPGAAARRMSLVFTGTLSQMPDAEVFLEAVAELCRRRPEARRRVRVTLAGPHESGYPDRALGLGLTGIVEFTGPVDHARARALQQGADLLLLWKPSGAAYRTMVPGKLYEYLSARRPLLALLPEGDEAAALARAGGAEVMGGQRAAVADALERHYVAFLEGAEVERPVSPWLASHERPRLVERMAGWLDQLAGESARP